MARDKYKEFLNYLHNELDISKADIRQWTHDAVYEVAENYIEKQFSERSLEQRILALVRDKSSSWWDRDEKTLEKAVKELMAKELLSQVKVNIDLFQIEKKPTIGACPCMTCSGYCGCKIKGHHDQN